MQEKKTVKQKDEDSNELIPPKDDIGVGPKIFEMLAEIVADKEALGVHANIIRNNELVNNQHWSANSGKMNLVTGNLLYTHLQRSVNMLTDNNPTFNVTRVGAAGEVTDEQEQLLLHATENWWIEQEQQAKLERSVMASETNGATIEKIHFNPDLEQGLGEVETEIIDAMHVGVYPVTCQDEQKADAILHFYPMSVREARRTWPEFADEFKGDYEILEELNDTRREVIANSSRQRRTTSSVSFGGIIKTLYDKMGGAKNDNKDDQMVIVECWCKDYTEKTEVVINEETGTEEIVSMPKYPGYIRVIKTCNAGEIVLSDEPNKSINPELPLELAQKTYLYDKYPFTFTNSIPNLHHIWGQSDFQQLEQLQIEIDKVLSQITTYKDKISRLKLMNPANSGVKNSELNSLDGIINPTSAMTAQGIGYLQTPPIPPDLLQCLDIYKEFFFTVAGTFDIDNAQAPGKSVIAYKAIAALLERASTMRRGKIRAYGKMIRERGRMYISHLQNWYTEDRYIPYNKDGMESGTYIKGQDLIIPAKITVVSGSTMPRSKVQEREEAIELGRMNYLPPKEVLKKLDYPNLDEVVKQLEAGPVGEMVEKMMAAGLPEPIAQYFGQIGGMDQKEVQKGVESGEIPQFMDVLQQVMQAEQQGEDGQEPQEPELSLGEEIEVGKATAESDLKQAQAAQIDSNIGIAERKAELEEQLLREKIESERVEQLVRLQGVEFDTEKIKIEKARLIASMNSATRAANTNDDKNLVAAYKANKNGPYREKGLASNNREL